MSVGGCAIAGETSKQAAEREILEEIGYKIDLSCERPYFTVNFANGFDDIYILERDINLSDLKLQDAEVQAVKLATKEEINQLLLNQKFIPYHQSFIDSIFDYKNNGRGTHRK